MRCSRCKHPRTENPYVVEPFVCWECRNVWVDPTPPCSEPTADPFDGLEDEGDGPVTWPPFWTLAVVSYDKGYCSRHMALFPAKGACVMCVAEGWGKKGA